jgi:protease I
MTNSYSLTGYRVAVLATDGVEDAELREPREALKNAGAQVTLIAPKQGKIQ